MDYLIFAINPGSTSTKTALFKNEEEVYKESITHPHGEIEKFDSVLDQIPMRRALVLESLRKSGHEPKDLSCVVGRGGLLPPMKTGGYRVNEKMLDLVLGEKISPHASNLGSVLASELAREAGVEAYIYDAESSDEFIDVAKITGMKEIKRRSICHVLNSRAVAIKHAKLNNRQYRDLNLIVAHLGGGITMGAHMKGRLVDTLADDNGAFAPERAGGVPLLDLIDLCYSGRYTKGEMIKKVRGMGGLRDLLGTSDGREIANMVENGDEYAILVMKALAYQIAKGIVLVSTPLKGEIDAILLTGGLAHIGFLVDDVIPYVAHMAPIATYPGEFEMEALALGALRILRKEEGFSEMG